MKSLRFTRLLSSHILIVTFLFSFSSFSQQVPLPGTLEKWMNYESFSNDKRGYRIPTRDHSKLGKNFQAESATWFDVETYWIPEAELNVAAVESQIPQELRGELIREVNGVKSFRLFVHPESKSFYEKLTDKYSKGEPALARATASSRTVLMTFKNKPELLFFAKLSLNVNLGTVVRTIPANETVQSVGISTYVQNKKKTLHKNFNFITEPLGIIPKGWDRGGQIIRVIPREILVGKTELIPLFSLTAPQEEGAVLLEKMIKNSGLKPYEFVQNKILRPFVQAWVNWVLKGALSMEAHSQNVLMEVDIKGLPTGVFYHRDAGGMNVDLSSSEISDTEKNKFPFFTNLEADYHQNFVDEARATSLEIYFKDRFLYNVDRELKKIDPTYIEKQLLRDLWVEVGQEIHNVTGLSMQELEPYYLQYFMPKVLKSAQEALKAKNKITPVCGRVFH